MQQCDKCKMDIPVNAFKCGHCGEWLIEKEKPEGKDEWDRLDIFGRFTSLVAIPLLIWWVRGKANDTLKNKELDAKNLCQKLGEDLIISATLCFWSVANGIWFFFTHDLATAR